MDFASGLANLEQAAANSQNNRRRGRENNYHGDDHRRYQPRPRHYDNRRDNYNSHHRNHHHRQQNDRALDGLARYGYRLPRGPYIRPTPIKANTDRPLHICLLAITIDDLPYEDIWKAWSESSNPRYKVSLLCHAKYPERVQSDWLKRRMILHPRRIVRGNSLSDPEYLSHKPAWGSVEITRGMIDLLSQAMEMGRKGDASNDNDPRFSPNRFLIGQDEGATIDVPPADKFIFISETCLPVTTLEESMKALFVPMKRTTEPSKPRWEPPPSKAVATPVDKKEDAVENTEGEVEKKEDTEEKIEETKEGADKKEGDEPKQDDANKESANETTAETSKPAPAAADNPINKMSLPDEEVLYLDISWVNARNFNSPNTPQNMYERDQFNNIHGVVHRRYRWKADQWMVLSRAHASAVLDIDHSSNIPPKDQLWNSFCRINASDEMYFPTTLAIAGVLVDHNSGYNRGSAPSNDASPWLERRRVTYTDWSMGMRNPASFTKGIKDFANVARLARQQKTLFARKFCPYLEIPGQDATSVERTGEITVEEWKNELETIIQQEAEGAEVPQKEDAETANDKANAQKEEEAPAEAC